MVINLKESHKKSIAKEYEKNNENLQSKDTSICEYADKSVKIDKIKHCKFWLDTSVKYKNECIIVVDKNVNVVYYNDPKSNYFDELVNPKDVIGKNIFKLLENLKEAESTFYRVLKTGEPIFDYIQTFVNYANKRVTAVSTTLPLLENNKVIGAVEILGDINNYKKLHKKVTELQDEDNYKLNLYTNGKNERNEKNNGTTYTINDLIGESNEMINLRNKILKIADSSSSVLIYGETGTGKELVVQAIHNCSFIRKDKPFIAQNCAAIPKDLLESILFGTTSGSFTGSKEKPGLFELADGGTLLLDEINSMNLELQAKLLRVLQTGEIMRIGGSKTIKLDVRVVATSNINPLEAVAKGLIRQDLYYRLNVISLFIPPLRERRTDIEILLNYYVKIYNRVLNKNIQGISDSCKKYLVSYVWPGNTRELRYTVENIMNFIENDIIDIDDLPNGIKNFDDTDINNSQNDELIIYPLNESIKHLEISMIKKALSATNGNQAKAAKLLEIPRQTLFNKIVKYNIKGNIVF